MYKNIILHYGKIYTFVIYAFAAAAHIIYIRPNRTESDMKIFFYI